MSSNHNNYFHGIVYCLVATLSWGMMFPVMTHALQLIDPFTFTAIRYTFAGATFLVFLLMMEGRQAFRLDGNLLLLTLFGSAGFAGFGCLVFLGQQLAGQEGALSASIMMASMPMLGLLANWALKGARPPLLSFAFILMSFFGVLLVMTKGHISLVFTSPSNYAANGIMILGALCWVLYTIGASYFPKWSPVKYTALSTLFGLPAIYVINIYLLQTGHISLPSITTVNSVLPELIYMTVVAGFVGVLCWNQGNKIITPLNGVLFMDVVPITAFIVSSLEGVAPTSGQIMGITLTATALIFNNLYQRQRMMAATPLASVAK